MKRYILHITAFVSYLLVSSSMWGQGTSGTWSETTLNANKTINLTGDINVKGPITIPDGITLTIKPNGSSRTIRAIADINQIFNIQDGGKLVIDGTKDYPITINGGATFPNNKTFTVSGDTYTPTTASGYKLDEAIKNTNGTMTLNYVTIQNVNGKDSGGGILINGTHDGKSRTSTLNNCIIMTCVSEQGSAIQITNNNDDGKGNAENCKLEVNNCTIHNCYSTGTNGGSGGTIRTNGGCVSNLYFRSTTVKDNYTGGAGCGIYWNGKGTDETKCVFDGCTFENNVAYGQGGGMMLETNFEFVNTSGNPTTIKNNKVINSNGTGGGIIVTSYGGGAMAVTTNKQYTFTYDLSDNVIIEGNTAGQGAGISFNLAVFKLNTDWVNNNNSSRKVIINLNLEGATIKNNKASNGNGGGIRFFNNTANIKVEDNGIGDRSLEINVKLNKGTIYGNTATGNGAGIYLYNANISNNAGDSDLLTVESNEAAKLGGGIYVDGGKTISLKNNSMNSNKATEGAAIYLSGGSGVNVTLGKTTMTSNISTGDGGALFVNGGNLTINGDESEFTSNSSTSGNGGFAYVSGTVNINGNSTATGNTATSGNGGYAYIESGDFNIATDKTLSIQNNSSKNGGGIYMGGGTFTLNGKATLNNNSATSGNGGAIYLGSGLFMVSDAGTINLGSSGSGNKAVNGNGGGIYCAGTFTVKGKAVVSHNQAKNGGGVCVQNGGVTLQAEKGSTIDNNSASEFGGGLYVLNSGSDKPNVSFEGGTFTSNSAQSGGAVCASGSMSLTLAATMEGNSANNGNGGAIYMIDGVDMTFGDGLIRANEAKGQTTCTTAYQTTGVTGVGGGIFMGDNTTLIFNSNEMGIYNNSATNAGADICANGNSTSITLPDITYMNLKGFDVPGNALYWVEDYFTGESNTISQKLGIRYEDALKNIEIDIADYIIDGNKSYTDYLCLDLGYDMVFVELTTSGLDNNDSGSITMSYTNPDGDDIVYRKVLFTGNESKVIGLPSGDWKLGVTGWSFKYNTTYNPEHTEGYIKFARDEQNNVEIKFTPKTNGSVSYIKEFQHRVVNRMVP